MLHHLRTTLAALALIVPSLGAMAQDAQSDLAFDGFFLGAGVGFAEGSGDTDFPILSGSTTLAPFDSGTGNQLSVYGGYQIRRDAFVYGIEAGWSNLNDVSDASPSGPETREVTGVGDVRGRIGYVTGDLMLYGALGWSWGTLRVHPDGQFAGRENSITVDGLNYGAGAEYLIGGGWTLGADITFRELSGDFDEAGQSSDVDVNTLSVRLGFQF